MSAVTGARGATMESRYQSVTSAPISGWLAEGAAVEYWRLS